MTTQMKTVLDVLNQARELIKRGWCQHDFAQDAEGEAVGSGSDAACRFCATGAIRHAARIDDYLLTDTHLERDALKVLAKAIGVSTTADIPVWNDTFTRQKQDVVEAFDIAIEQESNRASMPD